MCAYYEKSAYYDCAYFERAQYLLLKFLAFCFEILNFRLGNLLFNEWHIKFLIFASNTVFASKLSIFDSKNTSWFEVFNFWLEFLLSSQNSQFLSGNYQKSFDYFGLILYFQIFIKNILFLTRKLIFWCCFRRKFSGLIFSKF